jgi:hypothetical protein
VAGLWAWEDEGVGLWAWGDEEAGGEEGEGAMPAVRCSTTKRGLCSSIPCGGEGDNSFYFYFFIFFIFGWD